MAETGFDIMISVLLLATIIYSIRVSRKLSVMQKAKGEMQTFLVEFDRSIQSAEQQIATLRSLSEAADGTLKEHIDKARFLANDLSFLSDKGEQIADQLEVKIDQYRSLEQKESQPRKTSPAAMSPIKKQTPITASKPAAATPVAKRAARAVEESSSPVPRPVKDEAAKESKKQAIEALLQQIQSTRGERPPASSKESV